MLILVRHGRTVVNAGGRLQGRVDTVLDEVGREQARLTGEHLRGRFPGATVISSPLARAVETASAVSDDVTVDGRFVELDYGDWDGLRMDEVPAEKWRAWRNNPHLRPPNGETLAELDARVRPALVELVDAARTGHVIVVSHVSPIKSAVTWALGAGPEMTWRMSLDRASICTVAVGPNGPALASFNETHHLVGVER
ncbi:MAG: histidine phosphatase family protein [Acidimicrobiales bacterium]